MSDITALVFTLGEETTQRAIESIKKQSLKPKEIIIMNESVRPFYQAINLGASKVRTEFFVQVDSDMILDEDCFEKLRGCMRHNLGIVAGHLRDPLTGRACCIKMYRKDCIEKVKFKDSISPDVDFREDILKYGWCGICFKIRW